MQVEGIDVFYGDLQALWGVSLTIQKGQIASLIGGNGAGKSTIIQTISNLLHPARGRVIFDGTRIDHQSPHKVIEMGISLVLEGRRIFPGMTVLENLELGAFASRARKSRSHNLEKVFAAFPKLESRKRQMAETLSGGEQQMLVMGRCLMSEPRLMMVDEVSPGLAPIITLEIFRIMKEINSAGVTILLVEQNAMLALEVSDKGYVVEGGHIVGEGSARELLTDSRVRKAYLGME